jgi:beta-phosphoglucomutase-like phosphatase (HAD superfamily)
MTTETDTVEDNQDIPEVEEKLQFALIFELEYIAANAREAEFNVLQSVLKDKKKEVTEIDFSRFCMTAGPGHYLPTLLPEIGGGKLGVPKIADDVTSGVAMHLTSSDLEITPGLDKVIKVVQSKKMILAAITSLPENVYAPLIAKIGLPSDTIKVISFSDVDKHFPRADAFLKVAKELEVAPRFCTALVSTSSSCKSALTAGMRCIAIPDRFTAFQDFGGASSVADSLSELDAKEALSSVPS